MSAIYFNPTDIVVWRGIITTFGVIEPLVDMTNPELRKPTNDEVIRFHYRQ